MKDFHNEVYILWSFLSSYQHFAPDISGNRQLVGILCFREWMPEFPEATKTRSSDCCTASFISPHILPFLPEAAVLSFPCLDSVKGFKTSKGLLFKENRLEHARKQLHMDKPFTFRSYNKFRLTETS